MPDKWLVAHAGEGMGPRHLLDVFQQDRPSNLTIMTCNCSTRSYVVLFYCNVGGFFLVGTRQDQLIIIISGIFFFLY